VIRGPTPRDPFDPGDVDGVLAGQIEVTNDDHQLAGDGVERVSASACVQPPRSRPTTFMIAAPEPC